MSESSDRPIITGRRWGKRQALADWHARQMLRADRLHAPEYEADSTIYYGVDPASGAVVVMRRLDGGGVEILATHVPNPKPEDMWEGGDWLFHVARGI